MHMSWARIWLLFHFSALHFTSCITHAVTYSHTAPHTPYLQSPSHSLALTIRPFGQAMEHSPVANICTCYRSRVTRAVTYGHGIALKSFALMGTSALRPNSAGLPCSRLCYVPISLSNTFALYASAFFYFSSISVAPLFLLYISLLFLAPTAPAPLFFVLVPRCAPVPGFDRFHCLLVACL